jgi:hypothetical protein
MEEKTQLLSDLFYTEPASTESQESRPGPSLHDNMLDVLSQADKVQEGEDREKLLRAVRRTEASVDQKQWWFFNRAPSQQPRQRTAFPEVAANGQWKFLADPETSDQWLADGIPSLLLRRGQGLPDEIFRWICNEILCDIRPHLRHEYFLLVSASVRQTRREDRLYQALAALGASPEAMDVDAPIASRDGIGDGSTTRDWSGLRTILEVLTAISGSIDLGSVTRTTSLLLRLGIDDVVSENCDIANAFSAAIESLLSAVPTGFWNKFVS